MADDKFMLISLEDPKAKSLADVMGSKTCKKIIDYLAVNEEASQKDLSDALEIPMNTMEYNMKKLLASGLVQKRKNFFWSKKGKKIVMYELSNKSIVIAPKRGLSEKMKSLLPAFMITGVLTFGAYVWERLRFSLATDPKGSAVITQRASDFITPSTANSMFEAGASDAIAKVAMDEVVTRASDVGSGLVSYSPAPLWTFFLMGGLIAIFVLALINWRKL